MKDKGCGDDWKDIERNVVREILPNATGRVGSVEEIVDLVAFIASRLGAS